MVYGNNALNSYQKAQVSGEISPKKLILMLYEGAIKRINLAKEGVKRDDPKQRGENIGKAIAIISELNASLDKDIKTDEIEFLRSLYVTMMHELAKVSVTNDVDTLDRANKYLMELKRIWETTVMNTPDTQEKPSNSKEQQANTESQTMYSGYESHGNKTSIAI